MHPLRSLCVFVLVCVCAAVRAQVPALHGAGATFPMPLYRQWADDYARAGGAALDYAAVGSAAGIARIRARAVDFGASDAPLDADTLAREGLLQFPAAIGAVVPVVNLAGVRPDALRLTGEVLAGIYAGRVRRWDDAAIAALNPELRLPRANITVVHRLDASGTTLLFTTYLAGKDAGFALGVGAGLERSWPVGVGGVGNDGVAALVQRTRQSIGYVEYAYAIERRLARAQLRNRDGAFVSANVDAFEAAIGDWRGGDLAAQLPVDRAGSAAWPLVGASFILVSRSRERAASTRAAIDFFAWSLREESGATRALGYVAMPEVALRHVEDSLDEAPPH